MVESQFSEGDSQPEPEAEPVHTAQPVKRKIAYAKPPQKLSEASDNIETNNNAVPTIYSNSRVKRGRFPVY